ALELAPHGVTVNAVAPGAIDTPLNARSYTPEVRRTYEERIPMRHIGTADEVAGTILFLASEEARYVTGQEIVVDGGLTIDGRGRVAICCAGDGSLCVLDGDEVRTLRDGFTQPNYAAFTPDGTLYFSDSGNWSRNNGRVYRLDADGTLDVFSEALPNFPNGC